MRYVTCWLLTVILAVAVAPATAQMWWCEYSDDIYATVDGSSLTIHHDAALYNCCPEDIVFDVQEYGFFIEIEEHEILDIPCPCMCCYELTVDILNLWPGDYTIVFGGQDYETGWQTQYLYATVHDEGQGGSSLPGGRTVSDCIEDPTAVPDPEDLPPEPPAKSWGSIKACYR